MNTKKILLAVVAVSFLSLALSSCDRKTCPTYSQADVKVAENNG